MPTGENSWNAGTTISPERGACVGVGLESARGLLVDDFVEDRDLVYDTRSFDRFDVFAVRRVDRSFPVARDIDVSRIRIDRGDRIDDRAFAFVGAGLTDVARSFCADISQGGFVDPAPEGEDEFAGFREFRDPVVGERAAALADIHVSGGLVDGDADARVLAELPGAGPFRAEGEFVVPVRIEDQDVAVVRVEEVEVARFLVYVERVGVIVFAEHSFVAAFADDPDRRKRLDR